MIKNKDMFKFKDLTSFYASLDSDTQVEISNNVSNKRLVLNKEHLIKVIYELENDCVSDEVYNELEKYNLIGYHENNKEFQHWKNRNWQYSLDYYSFSRSIYFKDNGQNYNEKRLEILQSFMAQDGPPPAPRKIRNNKRNVKLDNIFNENPKMNFGELLKRRTNIEEFSPESISFNQFSKVLYEAFEDIRVERERLNENNDIINLLKGISYPFDFYVMIFNVEDIDNGIYFYDVVEHELELINKGCFRDELQKIMIGQQSPLTSAFSLFISVNYMRKQWRYRHERGLRNTYINSAQICQKFLLGATNNRMFCNITPATRDSHIADLLKLENTREQVLYTINTGFSGKKQN